MDLYFDATEPGQVHELRKDLERYFERHAAPESDLVVGADKPGRFETAHDYDARPADA
jgi:hypothetical protein